MFEICTEKNDPCKLDSQRLGRTHKVPKGKGDDHKSRCIIKCDMKMDFANDVQKKVMRDSFYITNSFIVYLTTLYIFTGLLCGIDIIPRSIPKYSPHSNYVFE